MSRRSVWNWFGGKPRERFSLEELDHLLGVLEKNPVSGAGNKEAVVEALRSIAELLIWGDQHEPRFFEHFLERDALGHFAKILAEGDNRGGDVAKQVLQTLSIMIQNLRSEASVFQLFRDDHMNDIVQLRFDFSDEEVLGYYISFLKTISLRLNVKTAGFFLRGGPGKGASFPLYTEATKFIAHKDGMVRTAVRTLTLNIFNVQDARIRDFVVSKPANGYFTELALYATEQCQALDLMLSTAEKGGNSSISTLDSQLAEIEGVLSYFNDILSTGSETMGTELSKTLWEHFVGPVLLWPLLDIPSTLGNRPQDGPDVKRSGAVRPVCALYVMERLFKLVDNPTVVNAAAACLLAGSQGQCVACQKAVAPHLDPTAPDNSEPQGDEDGRRADSEKQTSSSGTVGANGVVGAGAAGGGGSPVAPSPFAAASQQQPGVEPPWEQAAGLAGAMHRKHMWSRSELYERYRDAFLSTFTGNNCQLGVAAVRVLVALILNMSADVDVLDVVGLLPHRHRIRKDLLTQLSATELEDDAVTTPRRMDMPPPVRPVRIRRSRGSIGSDELASFRLPLVPEGSVASQADAEGNKLPLISEGSSANGNDPTSPLNDLTGRYSASPRTRTLVDELLEAVVGGVFLERTEEEAGLADGPVPGSEFGTQMVNVLCSLLLLPTLPSVSICHAAWLLNQLLPSAGKGQVTSRLEAGQVDNIQAALRSARQGLVDEVRGMWCDALLPLVHLEWPKARQVIMQPALDSTANAVLAWLHAQKSFETGKALAARRGPAAHQIAGRGSLSLSAQAAVHIHHKVKRLVAMMQVNELLSKSDIPEACILPAIPDTDIATTEVKESSEVDLSKSTNIRCAVAFAKGQERTVYFTVYGSPTAALTECGKMEPQDIEGVAKSMPVVILAAPSEKRANSGTVLSVAPLLGTDPVIDNAHPRWLHLHVRPPVRRFVRAIKSSEQGNRPLTASWQQLVDGHWVLSFPDEDAAINARALVQEQTAKITAMYSDVLSPMLSPSPSAPS